MATEQDPEIAKREKGIADALKSVYQSIDVDNNGTLDAAELDTWADKIVNHMIPPFSSDKWQEYQKNFLDTWKRGTSAAASDADQDKKVTLDEFVKSMSANINDERILSFGRTAEQVIDTLYRLCAYDLKSGKELAVQRERSVNDALKAVFQSVDVNNDNQLDAAEMNSWAEKVVNMIIPPNSIEGWEAHQKGFLEQWKKGTSVAAQDSDGDGKVSMDEFIKGMSINVDLGGFGSSEAEVVDRLYRLCMYGLKTQEEILTEQKPMFDALKAVFQSADVDGDNKLNASEIKTWASRLMNMFIPNGCHAKWKEAQQAFLAMWDRACSVGATDVDKDGKVSADEFIKSMMINIYEGRILRFGSTTAEVVDRLYRLCSYGLKSTGEMKKQAKEIWKGTRGYAKYKEKLMSVFKAADKDGDGQLSPGEVKTWKEKLMKVLDPKAVNEKIGKIINSALKVDVDADKRIDLVDFIGGMFSSLREDGIIDNEAEVLEKIAGLEVSEAGATTTANDDQKDKS